MCCLLEYFKGSCPSKEICILRKCFMKTPMLKKERPTAQTKSQCYPHSNLPGFNITCTSSNYRGLVAKSVTCLAADASLTADPRVASSIAARSHTFLEVVHEIISTFFLLPSAESFKKGWCQLQAKVCARSTA